MEAKKQATSLSSSSSLAAELFGSKLESSSSSSSTYFNSIFPRPSKVYMMQFLRPSKAHGKDYISSEWTEKNYDSATKRDNMDKEDKSQNNKMDMSPFYEQERSQPCNLSSSIYYGGQDVYTSPRITKKTPGHSTYEKDGEDDGRASRGNWWQGSLYY